MRLSLTKEAEYALRALVWLAQQEFALAGAGNGRRSGNGAVSNGQRVSGEPAATRHKAAAIAAGATIPPVFAARVLANLQRQGLLNARAGQQGGYRLARPADDISLLEVIEAVEGPLVTQNCVLRDTNCGALGRYCVLHDSWSAAQDALRTSLAQTPLSSAVRKAQFLVPSS